MTSKPNTSGVRDALANAEPVRPRNTARKPGAAPKGGNGGPPDWSGVGLPDNCPVRAVGAQKTTCLILDALGQLIEAGPRDLGQSHLSMYFAGNDDYLSQYWPYYDKDGEWKPHKFTPERVQRSIQKACTDKGMWADFERVRGRGAWRDEDGDLVLHCGDVIFIDGAMMLPDIHDRFVYPAGAPITRPQERSASLPPAHHRDAVGPTLMRIFKTWNWNRPVLDPRLFLGALVASMLGGALHWRPSAWITGDSGSGKTTLMNLRRDIAAGWSFNAENATESGISTMIGFDAIGVSLDEQENGQDNRQLMKIVELMRQAASGGLKVRGSASHSGHAFRARNSFIASSINAAPLKNQDMNRMALMELKVLPEGAVKTAYTRAQAQGWGAEILRRCVDNWKRFDKTLEAYQRDLGACGHDQRGQDTFGVLLACADLVLSDQCMLETGGDPDRNELWKLLDTGAMAEYADRMKSWEACLQHLLSSRPRDWKVPGPASVGDLVSAFLRGRNEGQFKGGEDGDIERANAMLGLAGMCVMIPRAGPFIGKWCLGIPNQHPGLAPIFDNTDWRGEASTSGGWIGALGRGDPRVIQRGSSKPDEWDGRIRIAGQQKRGVIVRLDQAVDWKVQRIDREDVPEAR